MNDSDRRWLEGMDTRELADLGISRCDLPRLYAESARPSPYSKARRLLARGPRKTLSFLKKCNEKTHTLF